MGELQRLSPMSYFEEDFATVAFDESMEAVVATVHDYAEGETFRAYMDSIIDGLEDTGTSKLLADTTDMGPLDQDDQVWSVQDWAPRAEAAGLEHIAFVMPESVIANLSVENVMDMVEDGINRNYFDDPVEARQWLREQGDADYPAQRDARESGG
jgi:hypothetical protein